MNKLRRAAARTLICLMALSGLRMPIAAQDTGPVYDIVIRNGRVLDGAGNPWIRADVAIKDGRFVRIGTVEGTAGARSTRAAVRLARLDRHDGPVGRRAAAATGSPRTSCAWA